MLWQCRDIRAKARATSWWNLTVAQPSSPCFPLHSFPHTLPVEWHGHNFQLCHIRSCWIFFLQAISLSELHFLGNVKQLHQPHEDVINWVLVRPDGKAIWVWSFKPDSPPGCAPSPLLWLEGDINSLLITNTVLSILSMNMSAALPSEEGHPDGNMHISFLLTWLC